MSYTKLYNPARTPQSEPIPGRDMVENSAGGYVFQIDKWGRLARFLILGGDAPTYYASARTLTMENAAIAIECWGEDPDRTASAILDISVAGRAPKNSPAIFALALGVIHEKVEARQAAYLAMPHVCRTASHLFEWLRYCEDLGKGSGGRGMKRAIATWYRDRTEAELAFQAIKYRERKGWTHKRALEVMHQGAGENEVRASLYRWMRGKGEPSHALIIAHEAAMKATTADEIVPLVTDYRLPWEAIPTWCLTDPKVWKAMLPHMGLTALIRNLGNMTACGAIGPMDTAQVVARLSDVEALRRSRVHPFSILQALAVYKAGRGVKGSKTWVPERAVIDALDSAFYAAFENVESTGKRILLALDVSGSMNSPMMGSPLTCREASAAMALVTMAREPNTHVVGFTSPSGSTYRNPVLTPLAISPRQRLDDVVRAIAGLHFGGTDCALPMLHAMEKGLKIDAFVIYTDNETWAGRIHPSQALKQYRAKSGIPAKCIVVGMTSTGFSIADPQDGGMLDLVGFDSAAPALISDFIRSGASFATAR